MVDARARATSGELSNECKRPALTNSVALVASSTFVLSLLLQLADHFDYLHARIPGADQQALAVARLLGKQGESLIVCCLLAASFIPMSRPRWARWSYLVILTLSQLAVALNHAYFGMFFEYFEIDRNGDWNTSEWQLWIDSLVRDASLSKWLALFAIPVLIVFWARQLLPPQQRVPVRWLEAMRKHGTIALVASATLIAASLAMEISGPDKPLVRHPLVVLARSLVATPATVAHEAETEFDNPQLIYGRAMDEPEVDRALAGYLDVARRSGAKQNVIVLVLESVGGGNLLDDSGRPNADAMPFLASLSPHAVVFPNVYSVFPSTARSHLCLHTGGAVPTLSTIYSATRFRYQGETLPLFFRQHGYSSAMFSGQFLGFENLGKWYDEAGYDTIWGPIEGSPATEAHRLDSWGIDEVRVVDGAMAWVRESDPPFLLTFLSSGTHHPYSVPKSYQAPFPDGDRLSRYRTALRYADVWLERLWRALEQSHGDDTILAIVGDHGEAFGERHATNHLHRNFIYEENVRSFLMLLDPRLTSGPVISNELGSIGDVFPTLAHLAVGETPTSSGRSLLERPFTERVVFFHKRTEPWRWGLRDGNWKFIATQNDDSEVELYDLADDPMEQSNLAELHPEMVADYQTRVATWFFHSERDFARRRDGLGADVPALVLGRKQDGRFAPSSLFGPYDKIVARVEADPASTAAVSMRWEGPTGAPHIVELSPLDSRRTATIALTPDPSHALGRWRVALLVEGRERASGSFAVSSHVSDISD